DLPRKTPAEKNAYDTRLAALVLQNYELLTRPEYQREQFAAQLRLTQPMDWAEARHALGITAAYREGKVPVLRIPHNLPQSEARDVAQKAPPLSPEYMENATTVARRQIVLAGYRLADQLTTVFPRKAANP